MIQSQLSYLPCVTLVVLSCLILISQAGELMFELPDNDKMCFHELVNKSVKCTLEFQVITGGNYDVDLELIGPDNKVLYKEMKKQYDSFTWTADITGEHRFCFSNEFSTFTHKLVYFDLQVGDEDPMVKAIGDHATVLTQMETSGNTIHENMKTVVDYQTHHRLRESQGETFAEALNSWVLQWSLGQTAMILIVGIGQVVVLRSFFTDKLRQSEFSPKTLLST